MTGDTLYRNLRDKLIVGLQDMPLELSAERIDKLVSYLFLLQKWNRTHNLTAVRDVETMVGRHLLDSLSIHAYTGDTQLPASVLDVGAGAGLPGIPLAIAKPHINVTLVDSVLKKTQFMLFAQTELKLANVQVLHTRIETLSSGDYSFVVARAFTAIDRLCDLTARLLAPGGKILAMVGRAPDRELLQKLQHYRSGEDVLRLVSVDKLSVPGETAERNIVVLQLDTD